MSAACLLTLHRDSGERGSSRRAAKPGEGGLKVEAWATEPLLTNPVAFAFDEQGKCYVVETTRLHHGVPEKRAL